MASVGISIFSIVAFCITGNCALYQLHEFSYINGNTAPWQFRFWQNWTVVNPPSYVDESQRVVLVNDAPECQGLMYASQYLDLNFYSKVNINVTVDLQNSNTTTNAGPGLAIWFGKDIMIGPMDGITTSNLRYGTSKWFHGLALLAQPMANNGLKITQSDMLASDFLDAAVFNQDLLNTINIIGRAKYILEFASGFLSVKVMNLGTSSVTPLTSNRNVQSLTNSGPNLFGIAGHSDVGISNVKVVEVQTWVEDLVCSPPCQNGGKCGPNNICGCPVHIWVGLSCEIPCSCRNGAACHPNGQCNCPMGLSGDKCEIASNPIMEWSFFPHQTAPWIIRRWENDTEDVSVSVDMNGSVEVLAPVFSREGLMAASTSLNTSQFNSVKIKVSIDGGWDSLADGYVFYLTRPNTLALSNTPLSARHYGTLQNFQGAALYANPSQGNGITLFFGQSQQTMFFNQTTTALTTSSAAIKDNVVYVIKLTGDVLSADIMSADEMTKLFTITNGTTLTGLSSISDLTFGVGARNGAAKSTRVLIKRIEATAEQTMPAECDRNMLIAPHHLPMFDNFEFKYPGGANLQISCPFPTVISTASPANRSQTFHCNATESVWDHHNVQCVNASTCVPGCIAPATCQLNPGSGTYQCQCTEDYQPPTCRFRASYLPPDAVVFFPLSLNSYEKSIEGFRVAIDKSGMTYGIRAEIEDGITFSNEQICSYCTAPAFRFNTVNFGAISINLQGTVPPPANVTTIQMMFRIGSMPGPPFIPLFGWMDGSAPCKIAFWFDGSDNKLHSKVYVNETFSPSYPFAVTGSNVDSWDSLVLHISDSSLAAKIGTQPMSTIPLTHSLCRPSLANSGMALGGSFGIIEFIGVPPANHMDSIANSGVACFSIFNRQLSSEESDSVVKACRYDFLSAALPDSFLNTTTTSTTTSTTTYTTTSTEATTEPETTPDPTTAAFIETTLKPISEASVEETYKIEAQAEFSLGGNVTLPDGSSISSDPWPEELNDHSSDTFKNMSTVMSSGITSIYMATGLYADVSVTVLNITKGSFITDYMVALRSLTQLSESQIQEKVKQTIEKMASDPKSPIAGFNLKQASMRVLNVNIVSSPKLANNAIAGKPLGGTTKTPVKTSDSSVSFFCHTLILSLLVICFGLFDN